MEKKNRTYAVNNAPVTCRKGDAQGVRFRAAMRGAQIGRQRVGLSTDTSATNNFTGGFGWCRALKGPCSPRFMPEWVGGSNLCHGTLPEPVEFLGALQQAVDAWWDCCCTHLATPEGQEQWKQLSTGAVQAGTGSAQCGLALPLQVRKQIVSADEGERLLEQLEASLREIPGVHGVAHSRLEQARAQLELHRAAVEESRGKPGTPALLEDSCLVCTKGGGVVTFAHSGQLGDLGAKVDLSVWDPILATVNREIDRNKEKPIVRRFVYQNEVEAIKNAYKDVLEAAEADQDCTFPDWAIRVRLIQIKFDKHRTDIIHDDYWDRTSYDRKDAHAYFMDSLVKDWSKGNYVDMIDQMGAMETGHNYREVVEDAGSWNFYGAYGMSLKWGYAETHIFDNTTRVWSDDKYNWGTTGPEDLLGNVYAQRVLKIEMDVKIYDYLWKESVDEMEGQIIKGELGDHYLSLNGAIQATHLIGSGVTPGKIAKHQVYDTDKNYVPAHYYLELFYGFDAEIIPFLHRYLNKNELFPVPLIPMYYNSTLHPILSAYEAGKRFPLPNLG